MTDIADRDRAVACDYLGGASFAALRTKYGIGSIKINDILAAHRVEVRPNKPVYNGFEPRPVPPTIPDSPERQAVIRKLDPNRVGLPKTTDLTENIVALFAGGKSVGWIARSCNLSVEAVVGRLRRQGLEPDV